MDKARKYLKVMLPVLFIMYMGCLIIFSHVHIVNGITIVHSHPFEKNADGTPKENHNYAEFQLLHQLTHIQIEDAATVQIIISKAPNSCRLINTRPVYPAILRPFVGNISWRAPPFSVNI